MKKRVGIDARLYRKTGVGVYIRNLLHHIVEIAPDDIEFSVYFTDEDFESVELPDTVFTKRRAPYKWHSIDEQTKFLRKLNSDNLDLMHFTYFSYPILYRKPFIATIHDTIMFDHKTGRASTRSNIYYQLKHVAFQYVFRSQFKNALKIITPTKTVKKRLVKLFGNSREDKIQSITEGISYELKTSSANTTLQDKLPRNYFMYLGNFYPHKNVERLIEAFFNSKSKIPLILVGPDDYFLQRTKEYCQKIGAHDKIYFHNNATSEDLVYLYSHAEALIHPSFDEGFCLPLIEAAYFNLPIIASDIEVFHEIMGTSYVTFQPDDTGTISQAIDAFIDSRPEFDYSEILKKRSFEIMTQETLQIYRSLL